MYRLFYAIPFWLLCMAVLAFCLGWAFAKSRLIASKCWRWCHLAVLLLWFASVLYLTLWERQPGCGGVNLIPLWSYRIAFEEGSFDYFQQIYLNVLAFFFWGLFAPELFRGKWRFFAVVIAGSAISLGIEYCQFRLDVGLAEFDDILSNTIGTSFGMLVNLCAHIFSGRWFEVINRWKIKLLRFLHRPTTE